ncbi:hypothetical protein [Nannocystis exedens]|uniref:hypothetical protein n=1 Tax=Nannocystis exedens TaxID=54 RepID=UPI000BBA0AE1|nr:hypothetical protein [Nannocystis exedens]PCC66457.1 hypothetical protein NAEX_09045 [Nannocystis exedens]
MQRAELDEGTARLEAQLRANPNAHAYCLLAAVLQALANMAASVATTTRIRANVQALLVSLVTAMTSVAERQKGWSGEVAHVAEKLAHFITSTPEDMQRILQTYHAKIVEAAHLGGE